MEKAQIPPISITLIVILAIAMVSTAYLWARPLIQKRQDTINVEKLLSDFDQNNPDSLPRKIEYVAKTGGRVSFTISSDGAWFLSPPNYIQFSTFSKVSNIAVGKGWISYTPGGQCPNPQVGKIGEHSSVVCIKADPEADGYVLTYKVVLRELEETPERRYKIELVSGNRNESAERTIVLQFGGTEERITKVIVLL